MGLFSSRSTHHIDQAAAAAENGDSATAYREATEVLRNGTVEDASAFVRGLTEAVRNHGK